MDTLTAATLAPVSEENPCGADLSFSTDFDRVQEARREDDPTLDYGEWESTLKQADWHTVVRECSTLLTTKTKDMRVAAWLTEGLIKTSGFAGLSQGLGILTGLLEHFGADMHPRPDDDDPERCVGTISWFIQRIAQLIRFVPLTDAGAARYSLLDYEGAVSLQRQLQRHPDSNLDASDRVNLDKFASAVAATEKPHFQQQLSHVARCLELNRRFSDQLGRVLGRNAPSVKPIADSLEAVESRLRAISKELNLPLETVDSNQALAVAGGSSVEQRPMPCSTSSDMVSRAILPDENAHRSLSGISTRADALAALRQIANYFKAAEPHSPVAYLAEKALRWSDMPLHLWLRSVIKDETSLSHVEELLGAEERSGASD